MTWLLFGGSLAAVIALGAIAAAMKLGGPARTFLAEEEAMRAAEDAITGFRAIAAAVGQDGRAALVFGDGLRVVVLKTHGARHAAREIVWRDVRATAAGLVVETRERRFGSVLIAGVDNLDVRRLAPQLTQV